MAVISLDELVAKVAEYIGENTDDNAISLLEDVSDTTATLKESESEISTLKGQLSETENLWRKKYAERFSTPISSGTGSDNIDDTGIEPPSQSDPEITFMSYDDLFSKADVE